MSVGKVYAQLPSLLPLQGGGNAKRSPARKVAVIGGGWAGCAAAVELARQGQRVTLYEAARTLGGRARRVEIDGRILDNGQHILLGAYTETLRLMRTVGIDPRQALLKLPLQMRYPAGCAGMDFIAPRLPAPLHVLIALLRAKGLSRVDKMSLARFSTTARWMDWRLDIDCSVSELLERYDQTDRLIKLMWRPLCIAALNTPPERASAQVFMNVLRDSLGARRAASDMLLPRVDLSALFPQRAEAFIKQHGGTVECGTAIKALIKAEGGWRLDASGQFDAVVIATQPTQAAMLLDAIADTSKLTSLQHEPITTCYLQYDSQLRLEHPFFALTDDSSCSDWGQFVFDRGQLDANSAGLLAVVVSTAREAIESGHPALSAAIADQLAKAFDRPELSSPIWTKVITEKRATFSCTPALDRPPNATGVPDVVIAGDYTAGDYPATLESAIRSGLDAARLINRARARD